MATPYSQLPYGFRRGEGNYQYQEFLKRRMEEERQADFAARIAEERERISLSQWQPEPEQQEVKITTKADGTSTIVSTDKFPAQSLLDDPMGLEGTGTGDWGLSVTSDQAELDELRRINDLYAMGGQEDVGRVWAMPPVAAEDPLGLGRPRNQWDLVPADIAAEQDRIAYERQFTPTQPGHPLHQYWDGEKFVSTLEEEPVISPEGTPIAGFDMGGLQRFEPHIIPDEAYRQAYGALGGDQVRSMEMRGLLEDEARRAAIPPPPVQTIQPSPMVSRALAEVDRGTNNILPPLDVPSGSNILSTMEEIPPTLPNWLTGMGVAEAPFVAPQAITPEQGPLGPPMLTGVSPEMELQAALGEGGARYGQALPMQGLLTDEEILAGAQMPYGDPGVTPMERALMESQEGPPVEADTTDIFAGWTPQEDVLDPVDPGLRPRGRVETDIEESVLETAPKKWLDPDTGLIPIERGMLRDVPPLMEETPTQRRERLAAPVEEASIWGGDPALSGVRALRASYQEEQDKLVDESTERYEALMGRAEKAIEKAEETTEQTKKVIDFQRLEWFAKLNQQLTEKRRRQGSQVRVGRARSRQQIPMLNPTPLRSA